MYFIINIFYDYFVYFKNIHVFLSLNNIVFLSQHLFLKTIYDVLHLKNH